MMSMTSKNVNKNADIGGATLRSAPQICNHRWHHSFTAKRLVYRGRGNQEYVFFTVWSHHRSFEKARKGAICTKNYGYYENIGTLQQNDLILVK